jgi:predicted secreted Zn-dependent protease
MGPRGKKLIAIKAITNQCPIKNMIAILYSNENQNYYQEQLNFDVGQSKNQEQSMTIIDNH